MRSDWPEDKRVEWLLSELTGKRPLMPPALAASAEVADVLNTFKVAHQSACPFGPLLMLHAIMAQLSPHHMVCIIYRMSGRALCTHGSRRSAALQKAVHCSRALMRFSGRDSTMPCSACQVSTLKVAAGVRGAASRFPGGLCHLHGTGCFRCPSGRAAAGK